MNAFQILLLLYLLVVAGGGVMGYVSAQSTVSLIAGLASGLLLAVALALTFVNPRIGFGLASLIALALGLFFMMRFFETGKWMPGGITMILSAIVLIVMLVALFRRE